MPFSILYFINFRFISILIEKCQITRVSALVQGTVADPNVAISLTRIKNQSWNVIDREVRRHEKQRRYSKSGQVQIGEDDSTFGTL